MTADNIINHESEHQGLVCLARLCHWFTASRDAYQPMHCYQGYIKPEHTLLNINIFKDPDVLKLRLLLANGFCLSWQMPVQKEIKSFPTLTSFNFSSLLHCFIGLHPLLPTLQIFVSTGSLQGSDQYLKCSLCLFLYKWLFDFFSFICQISVGCKSTLGRKTSEKYFLKSLFHCNFFFKKRFLVGFFSIFLAEILYVMSLVTGRRK